MDQFDKVFNAIPPAAIKDDADFVSNVIDTVDVAYGEFEGLLGATDIAMATLKVMESETMTDATTLGGTPTEVLDVPTKPGAGDDNKPFVIGINFTAAKRKRYIQLQAKAGNGSTGTFLSAVWRARTLGLRKNDAASRGALFAHYV